MMEGLYGDFNPTQNYISKAAACIALARGQPANGSKLIVLLALIQWACLWMEKIKLSVKCGF